MPEIGGVEVCKSIRADSNIAIIMLTVRKSDLIKWPPWMPARMTSLKPFSTPELLARVRAALRRVPVLSGSSSKLQFGELVIDFGART